MVPENMDGEIFMTDSVLDLTDPVDNLPGDVAMSRLSDRLASMVPPSVAATLAAAKASRNPQFSPAVSAGLAKASTIAERAARNARQRSLVGTLVGSFVSACAFIPYALVALGLRLVMARVFFLDGQSKIEGLRVPVNIQDFDFSFVLPMQVRVETFTAFMVKYAAVPVPPVLAAYLVSGAEFILPIMLVLGLGTRFAALGLLVITAMIQFYVAPDMLGSVQTYWAAILLVLISLGAGQISADQIIRKIARR
jgi:putative oxidoreductase